MKSNEVSYSKWASWAWSVALAAAGVTGLWLWMTQGASLTLWSVGCLMLLMAVFGAFWLYRIRASRRLFTALDTYAQRELDRARTRRLASPSRNRHALSRGSA